LDSEDAVVVGVLNCGIWRWVTDSLYEADTVIPSVLETHEGRVTALVENPIGAESKFVIIV